MKKQILKDSFQYKTKGLVIRFYNETDYASWQELLVNMNSKQNQWDWAPEPITSLTKDRFRRKLSRHKKEREENRIYYFCVENEKGQIIGIGLINNIDLQNKTAEIGIQINNKYWGRGFGKETAKGLIDISFSKLRLKKVIALVNKANEVSMHIFKSLGMELIDENEQQYVLGITNKK